MSTVSKFKLKNEDEHSFTVQHPDGKEFQIAKSKISPSLMKQIRSFGAQGMADGGVVPDDENASTMAEEPKIQDPTAGIAPDPNFGLMEQYRAFAKNNDLNASPDDVERKAQDMLLANKQAEVDSARAADTEAKKRSDMIAAQDIEYNKRAADLGLPLRNVASNPQDVPGAIPSQGAGSQGAVVPAANQVPMSLSAAPPTLPGGAPGTSLPYNYTGNEALMEHGLRGQTAAQVNAQNQLAKLYEANTQQQQAQFEEYKKQHAALSQQRDQLVNDVMATKIDPNRAWNNMSTADKIIAGISIGLGGAVSGLAKQPNMALQGLQRAVDQDIESQKMELGKKQTLLSENMRRFGDLDTATQMTRLQTNAMLEGQVRSAMARSNSQQVQAQGDYLIGQLRNDALNHMAPLAMKGVAASMASGNGPAINPEYLPPDVRERAVQLPNGRLALAPTKEDAAGVRKSFTSLDSLDKQLNDMIAFQKNVGRTGMGTTANAQAEGMKNALVLELNKLHDLNRLNDNEFDSYMKTVPNPGEWLQDRALAKVMNLKKLVKDKRNAELANHLEGYRPDALASKEGRP